MSKFGRIPVSLRDLTVAVNGNKIDYKGKFASGVYVLPEYMLANKEGDSIVLGLNPEVKTSRTLNINAQWGLHRALLNNALSGARELFKKVLRIEGLGFKAILDGNKLALSLGFSYVLKKVPGGKDIQLPQINYVVPAGVSVEVDKTGQMLTLQSSNKELLGLVCSQIRDFRPPEPYKGKGIRYDGEIILKKAGKAKS